MSKKFQFIYGVAAYGIFFLTFLYLIGFIGNFYVPKSINSGIPASFGLSYVTNIILVALFGIQHTLMAREKFKKWLTTIIPPAIERSTYVMISNIVLILLFWYWRPMIKVVWWIDNAFISWILWLFFWIGWAIVLVSTFLIDHFELFGLRQVYLPLKKKKYKPSGFVTPGLYKYVRHPIMLGFLIAFWATPVMTVGHLLFSITMTAYIFIGTLMFEEKDLILAYGKAYQEYRETVPMLIPCLKKKTVTTEKSRKRKKVKKD